uniref:DUF6886 family protein n=1 Tax=Paenibacillus sp. FSL R5-0623 TaxID=2921651 RepID=UPI00403F7ED2
MQQTLHRYHLDEASFQLFNKTAGYYFSDQVITPSYVEKVVHLVERLLQEEFICDLQRILSFKGGCRVRK